MFSSTEPDYLLSKYYEKDLLIALTKNLMLFT